MNPQRLPQDLNRDLFLPGTDCLANESSETSSRSPEISLSSRYRLSCKCILRDFLKISREISFFQIQTVFQMHPLRLPQDFQRDLFLPGTGCLSSASSETSSRSPERSLSSRYRLSCKCILRDFLKIFREISFFQVQAVFQVHPQRLPQDLQKDLFHPETGYLANACS